MQRHSTALQLYRLRDSNNLIFDFSYKNKGYAQQIPAFTIEHRLVSRLGFDIGTCQVNHSRILLTVEVYSSTQEIDDSQSFVHNWHDSAEDLHN